jgi:hypothetical protein
MHHVDPTMGFLGNSTLNTLGNATNPIDSTKCTRQEPPVVLDLVGPVKTRCAQACPGSISHLCLTSNRKRTVINWRSNLLLRSLARLRKSFGTVCCVVFSMVLDHLHHCMFLILKMVLSMHLVASHQQILACKAHLCIRRKGKAWVDTRYNPK